MIDDKKPAKILNRRVHMANERTFLAWIRTCIGIMAFGFVVEKFALFVRQISYFVEKSGIAKNHTIPVTHSYSSILGIFLVGIGVLMGLLSFIRFIKIEKQIDEDTYRPSLVPDTLLTMSVLVIGIFLIIYLIYSI